MLRDILFTTFPKRFTARICVCAVVCTGVGGLALRCDRPQDTTDSETVVEIPPPQAAAVTPNVVWILLDACRADHLSCYGYPRNTTPALDAIASRGVVFEQHFAQAPNTLQSVPIYFTGRYNAVEYQDPEKLDIFFLKRPLEREELVSTTLRNNGYATAMFSASPWYSRHSRLAQSFETFGELAHGKDVPDTSYKERNPELFRWLDERRDRPFFLYLHSLDTHGPRFPNNTLERWLAEDFPAERDTKLRWYLEGPYSAADQQRLIDLYDGGVAYADTTVAAIESKLAAMGVHDDTLIVISSDHGELLGEDGITVGHPADASHDELLRTPLIIAGPGVPPGVRVRAFTENTDIAPTLTALLDLETNAVYHGSSLTSLFSNSATPLRDHVYARSQYFTLGHEPNRIFVFHDVKFDLAPYAVDKETGAFTSGARGVRIYDMPDHAGARKKIQAPPTRQERVENLLRTKFMPMWREKTNQADEIPAVFKKAQSPLPIDERIAPEHDPQDGQWGRIEVDNAAVFAAEYFLVSSPWSEEVDDLDQTVDAPNGTYRVQVYLSTLPGSSRGASISVWSPPDSTTKSVFELPPASGEVNEGLFELGTFTIENGTFAYRIGAGNPHDDAVIGSLWFSRTNVDGVELDLEAMRSQREALETLGYLQ